MMNWSGAALKLTIGVGLLAVTAILSDVLAGLVGVYPMIGIIIVPLALLVMIKPGELPDTVVKLAHIIAGLWYLALVSSSLYLMVARGFIQSDLLMGAFMAFGFAPLIVSLKALQNGGYDGAYDQIDGGDDFEPPDI